MMAVGLLAIAALSMIAVFMGGLNLMAKSEQRTQASNLGTEVLESIADQGGFHSLPETDIVFNGRNNDPEVDGFPPPPYPGNDDYSVTVESRVLTDRTRAVQVTVGWTEGQIKLEKVFNAVE